MEKREWQSDRRTFLKSTGAAGAAGMAVLAGCSGGGGGEGGTDDAGTTTGGGSDDAEETRIDFAQTSSPVALDPVNNKGGNYSIMLKNWVYSPVLGYDRNTNLVPILATEVPELSGDGTEFTIDLDERATFHNGDPVTAEDVKYTFNQTIEEETSYATNFNVIESMTVGDDQTLNVTLSTPYQPILHAIAFPIAPKSVREEDTEAFGTETIVGSGPFEVDEFEEGDHVKLDTWDDYWGDTLPAVDGVTYTPINESTTRVTNLKTGDMDIINRIPPKLWETVKGQDGAGISSGPGLSYQFAAFNQKEGECAKRKVRLAVDHCIDVAAAVEKYVAPVGSPMYAPIPKTVAEAWNLPDHDSFHSS